MKNNPEFETFNSAMDAILRANPQVVKAAMEEERKERKIKRSASVPSSSNRDALVTRRRHLAGDFGIGEAFTSHLG